MHRRAILVGQEDGAILVGILQLVVGVDGVGLGGAVEGALGAVGIGVADGGADVVDVEAIGGQLLHIDLDAHGRALAARQTHQTDACQLRNLLGNAFIRQIFDIGQGNGGRGDRDGDDRRIGGIDLGVDRRRRQRGRQEVAGGIGRRLHFLFGHIQAQAEVELQGQNRGAGRGDRRHFLQARHVAELTLERRRDRGRHHIGAGAGIEGLHLDGGIIHLRQGRQRQEMIPRHAHQQDRDHEQRRRHRPGNKGC
jgi:hypothetical protein